MGEKPLSTDEAYVQPAIVGETAPPGGGDTPPPGMAAGGINTTRSNIKHASAAGGGGGAADIAIKEQGVKYGGDASVAPSNEPGDTAHIGQPIPGVDIIPGKPHVSGDAGPARPEGT